MRTVVHMTEQQQYELVQRNPAFELRRYPPHVVAEVAVRGTFEGAGNRAFRVLFGYISGQNESARSVAMTAPVVQEQASARIAMTAPVVQEDGTRTGRHVVAFVMPSGFTRDTLPSPSDPRITVREIPAQVAAAASFSGRWSEHLYRDRLEALRGALVRAGLTATGAPRFARFDPPWTPWFLRRNEVVVPVAGEAGSTPAN